MEDVGEAGTWVASEPHAEPVGELGASIEVRPGLRIEVGLRRPRSDVALYGGLESWPVASGLEAA